MWHGRIAHYETAEGSFDVSSLSITVPYPPDPEIAMYAMTLANAAATGRGLETPELPQALVYLLNLCEEIDWDVIEKTLDIHAELIPVLRTSLERMIAHLP